MSTVPAGVPPRSVRPRLRRPGRLPRLRLRALGLALVLTSGVTLAGVAVVHGRAEASVASRCHRFAATHAALVAKPVTGSGHRIAVIGDSWSVGYRLRAPKAAWPARLPGRVSVDGFSGSGFSAHASPCGAVSFADRTATATGADLVVVEGGLNDFDQSYAAVRAGFRRLLHRLAGSQVLIVGPAPAPARAAGAHRVDRWLSALSKKAGVSYLSAIHLHLRYLGDQLHPTPAGQRRFGDFVAAHLP